MISTFRLPLGTCSVLIPFHRVISVRTTSTHKMVAGETKCFSVGSSPPTIDEQKLNVYSMRFCPYAERVRLLLNLKHVPYDVINVHLKEKPEWFLQRNPLGKVPTVEIPGKQPLFESLIVAEYLDEAYPGDMTFVPKDPFERARQKVLIEVINQKVITAFYGFMYKTNGTPAEDLIKGLDYVEKLLEKPYFAGDILGFVDLMVWPWFERLPALKEVFEGRYAELKDITKDRYPKLMDWSHRLLANPDIKSTAYPKELFVKFLQGAIDGKPNYDEGL